MLARLLSSAAGTAVLVLQSVTAHGAEEVSPAADAAAEQAYQRAELAYHAKDLPAALREMEHAYQLSRRVDLLYNLARIEDELGQCANARGRYQQYLERSPEGEAREEARRAVERLAALCGDPTVAPSAPAPVLSPPPTTTQAMPAGPSAAPTPSHRGSTQRWLGWSLVAGGVLAGAGTAYFWDAAIDSRDAYQVTVDREEAGGRPRDESLEADQHRSERAAQVLGVSSGALLVSGVLVLLLSPSTGAAGQGASVEIQPGRFAATYRYAF